MTEKEIEKYLPLTIEMYKSMKTEERERFIDNLIEITYPECKEIINNHKEQIKRELEEAIKI